METSTTEKLKKLPLKNAKFAHIYPDGGLIIGYEERHKTSGKVVTWTREYKADELPFKFYLQKSSFNYSPNDLKTFSFRTIYLSQYVLPLLNELKTIEFWPFNQGLGASYSVRTVVFNLKNKASIPFNEYRIEGKELKQSDVTVIY
jgi:hypothetical protein